MRNTAVYLFYLFNSIFVFPYERFFYKFLSFFSSHTVRIKFLLKPKAKVSLVCTFLCLKLELYGFLCFHRTVPSFPCDYIITHGKQNCNRQFVKTLQEFFVDFAEFSHNAQNRY